MLEQQGTAVVQIGEITARHVQVVDLAAALDFGSGGERRQRQPRGGDLQSARPAALTRRQRAPELAADHLADALGRSAPSTQRSLPGR